MMNPMTKAILLSYLRTFVASSLAVFASGVTEPKAIFYAGLISIIGPLLRWLNPEDKTFGKGAQDE